MLAAYFVVSFLLMAGLDFVSTCERNMIFEEIILVGALRPEPPSLMMNFQGQRKSS
jgi:hypothetical protein